MLPAPVPPSADADDDWSLTVSDDPPQPAGVPNPVARPWVGCAGQGLLLSALFLGSLCAGFSFFDFPLAWPQLTLQEFKKAAPGNPAPAVDPPPIPAVDGVAPLAIPPTVAKAPSAPDAPVREARPSLYDRVRRIVREHKTEETERLGIGDFPYQSVPEDGSILVGMEVSYAPFFTHHIIKSVRPVYQGPDGTRRDGPICGTPTGVRERVVAKEGYAIGGATIKAGMGIDGMQLTFMEIGADGLNPDKTYLSKWLGGYGGAHALMYVNDGRPIVGIAGMRAGNPRSPAFCFCFVTTKVGAIDAVSPIAAPPVGR